MLPWPPPPPQARPYKHFCRVCSKGFMCGSALGGHMRTHAVSDGEPGAGADDDDDDEPAVPDAPWGPSSTSSPGTHVYALRANLPNRLIRGCHVCKNCGKEFSSMDLFLDHGKCNSGEEGGDGDAGGSLHSSPDPSVGDGDQEDASSLAAGWSKGKRSRRAKLIGSGEMLAMTSLDEPEEEEDLANCLVMLSSSSKADQPARVADTNPEPCASGTGKVHGRIMSQQPQPLAYVLPAPDPTMVLPLALPAPQHASAPIPRGMFECKACKKLFTSHQALGGHRASHKKVKGCFAAKPESSVSASEPPHHAATLGGPNNEKSNAFAHAVVQVNVSSDADARTNYVDASTVGDRNDAGTSEAAEPSLSMAIVTTGTADHEPPVVALAPAVGSSKRKAKMHECSVCNRLFSSGQALGGHKRCHWLTSSTGEHGSIAPLRAEGLLGAAGYQLTLRPLVDAPEPELDLTIAANTSAGNSSLHLDTSAPLYLQASAAPTSNNPSHQNKMAATSSHNVNDAVGAGAAAENEADSTASAKKARLGGLKAVSTTGETTPWLQVGIGSSSADGDGKSTARE
ncbi:uncharacterized protein LOC100823737 [Brachypodium distachyon]|uniref:C2H2-type domain-containing protein n=1 Tax=Brachypodium distachyon TaxID=15368 RepID=A0A0Q3GSG8_BRADI|nr:uncharacterized protein LOC100823737 [Brachypodium distachyon]KQJ83954.1 hypothetical protein BRADI_5g17800v3 [Brachypodium distachyon]|eukprot:XP_003581506.1 uncharacterized protein LOC100823737 [Brachypodium distachyon]